MKITLIEPFFTGSHAAWAEGYAKHSTHDIDMLSLSGNYWKWRMHGGAVTLARQFLEREDRPDLILATDMLDVTTFLALTRSKSADIPVAIYFHENQLSYPWSPADPDLIHKRDQHYAFINYTSALAADAVFFNSAYHKNVFLDELPRFLRQFPDHRDLDNVEAIEAKSQVLHLGVDLRKFDRSLSSREAAQLIPADNPKSQAPLILWNHRWEYDKNPDDFFRALFELDRLGLDFRVTLLGERFHRSLAIFETARKTLGAKIVQFGYADDFERYAQWLHRADVLPVTSNQDFFGASIVEAVYCGCYPLLPKRLSYPELIPYESYAAHFYQSQEELVGKLVKVLREIDTIRRQRLSGLVERYAWQNIVEDYDRVFGEIDSL